MEEEIKSVEPQIKYKSEKEIKQILKQAKIWFKHTFRPDFKFDCILDEDYSIKIIKID
jgi:hypothetical protein